MSAPLNIILNKKIWEIKQQSQLDIDLFRGVSTILTLLIHQKGVCLCPRLYNPYAPHTCDSRYVPASPRPPPPSSLFKSSRSDIFFSVPLSCNARGFVPVFQAQKPQRVSLFAPLKMLFLFLLTHGSWLSFAHNTTVFPPVSWLCSAKMITQEPYPLLLPLFSVWMHLIMRKEKFPYSSHIWLCSFVLENLSSAAK